MGPGSSPGAGTIKSFLLKWLLTALTTLVFCQYSSVYFTRTTLNYSMQSVFHLEAIYSSWVLHVIFIYLVFLLLFKSLISYMTA